MAFFSLLFPTCWPLSSSKTIEQPKVSEPNKAKPALAVGWTHTWEKMSSFLEIRCTTLRTWGKGRKLLENQIFNFVLYFQSEEKIMKDLIYFWQMLTRNN